MLLNSAGHCSSTWPKPLTSQTKDTCVETLLEEKVFRRSVIYHPWVKSDVKIEFYI